MKTMKLKYQWTPESLEKRGKYLWTSELSPMLHQHLRLKQGVIAIDVGCGSGFFTRLMAKGLQQPSKVIGVDINRRLLAAAHEIAKKEKLSSVVEFKQGDAYDLPFPNNFADVVVCHTLLYILGKPLKAINEMVRVANIGGLVAAVEFDYYGRVIYDPIDKDYVELAIRFNDAVIGAFRKLYGADLTIGSKLPSMFLKGGLTDIRAYAYLLPTHPLPWDERYSTRELVAYYKQSIDELTGWSETQKSAMEECGISKREFEEYQSKTVERIKQWIKSPKKMRNHAFISARPVFVVVGQKAS